MQRLLLSELTALAMATVLAPHTFAADDIFSDPKASDTAALVQCLGDPNLRRGASDALVDIGDPAVSELTSALSSPKPDVRIWSADTLGRIGPDASESMRLLAEAMDADDAGLRAVAARSLGRIGMADGAVVEALTAALTDDDRRVREWSTVAIGELGAAAADAVPALVSALRDQSIRAEAVEAIVQIGAAAVPSLVAALGDDAVRLDAAAALRRIDPDAARAEGIAETTAADLPALRIALENPDRDADARIAVAVQLGGLGVDAAPVLIAALGDGDEELGQAAARALGEMGSDAVPLLREAFQSDSGVVRARGADALAVMGPDAHDAVEDVIALLEDADRTVRHRAVNALGEIGPAAAPAVEALIAVMQNPRDLEGTRQLAMKILARGGPDSRETVIAALRESTEDENFGIKSLAEQILEKISREAGE